MRLLSYKIEDVTYFCNEMQIKEAGGLEQAAKRAHEKQNPAKKLKPKKAEVELKKEAEKKPDKK